MKKKFKLYLLLIVCSATQVFAQQLPTSHVPIATVMDMFRNFKKYPNYIMVSGHRGYWQSYPENTTGAYNDAIAKGVDMVEIDVRATADDTLMIFHDLCLNRMTNLEGQLRSFTYQQIKDLQLKDRLGQQTTYKMLTVREALAYLKDRVVVNFDIKDAGDLYLNDLKKSLQIAKQLGVLNQIIVKIPCGGGVTFEKFMAAIQEVGVTLDDCIFTPVVYSSQDFDKLVPQYIGTGKIRGIELVYKQDSDPIIRYISYAHDRSVWVGQYTFWPEVPEGVIAENPKTCEEIIRKYYFANDGSTNMLNDGRGDWDWVMSKGPNFIVSDRPDLWIDYLTVIGKRNSTPVVGGNEIQ
jgi:hypothetical protein